MTLTRRDFLKGSVFAAVNPLGLIQSEEDLEQKIVVNLPAYSLTLMNYVDGNLRDTYDFPISIGIGFNGDPQTPTGRAEVYDKRKDVTFRASEDDPKNGRKKGQIIRWTNTFSDGGNPTRYKMPYDRMRGLGMKIPNGNSYYTRFVIHSTTDDFTEGLPASNGCIRLSVENMLSLYELISPGIDDGDLAAPIPIDIRYDLVELNNDLVTLHANVYGIDIDPVEELKKLVGQHLDYEKVREAFEEAEEEFRAAHTEIMDILSRGYPDNYVPESMKERLHKEFHISEFLNDL